MKFLALAVLALSLTAFAAEEPKVGENVSTDSSICPNHPELNGCSKCCKDVTDSKTATDRTSNKKQNNGANASSAVAQ